MAFTAKDVISRASIILQDAGAVRWPLPELLTWLNDAAREIAITKPNATAKTVAMELVSGTKQEIPATAHSLLQVVRNVDKTTGVGGKVITPIVRQVLDNQIPGWHDGTALPFAAVVRHVVDDALDQRAFYVVPGNDGTGKIEIVVSSIPADIPTPANPLDLDAYGATVDLQDIYRNVVVDYILYRAFSKDMNLPGAAQRAVAHYQQFNAALGLKGAGEAIATTSGQ